jgi:23S rRNA (pseudouridine1915-N3)-methyltransferase
LELTICAIGRLKQGPEQDLLNRYAKRLRWSLNIVELEEKKKLSPAELKQREGKLLADACPDGAVIVALDERGKQLSSLDFANKIRNWQDQGRDMAFLIGGADGMASNIRKRADFVLSLGSATWPHMLVRVMLLEQIYRGQEILAGNPYHRE